MNLSLKSAGAVTPAGLGRAKGSAPAIANIADGYDFHAKREATATAARCLATFSSDAPLLDTATGWTRSAAAKLGRRYVGPSPNQTEGFTLTAAADTLRALDLVQNTQTSELIVPIWGLTRQFSAYRVTA